MGCFSSKSQGVGGPGAARGGQYLVNEDTAASKEQPKQPANSQDPHTRTSTRSSAHRHKPSPKETHVPDAQPGDGPVAEVEAPQLRSSGAIAVQKSMRVKLDPKDFQYVELKGEVRIKEPGTIKGQSFMIDKCEDCDLYILDFCGQVTVDDCKNCRIFVGPCEGSVFLRDCSNCSFAVVARQLRTRDIHDCNIALLCRTRPIVETSTNVGFSCFDLQYQHFDEHLAAACMSPLHNFWYYIFDFTPRDGNWRLLPPSTSQTHALLSPIPDSIAAHLGSAASDSSLLVTWGDREPRPAGEYMFALFASKNTSRAMEFAREAASKGVLLRCNQAKLSADQASKMASEAKWSRSVEREMTAEQAIGVEFVCPEESLVRLKAFAQSLHAHTTDSEEAAALFRYLGIDG